MQKDKQSEHAIFNDKFQYNLQEKNSDFHDQKKSTTFVSGERNLSSAINKPPTEG